jgi:hypothetical protein
MNVAVTLEVCCDIIVSIIYIDKCIIKSILGLTCSEKKFAKGKWLGVIIAGVRLTQENPPPDPT